MQLHVCVVDSNYITLILVEILLLHQPMKQLRIHILNNQESYLITHAKPYSYILVCVPGVHSSLCRHPSWSSNQLSP